MTYYVNGDWGKKMEQKTWYARFYGVIIRKQTYKNMLYLMLSFPLSIIYFVLTITGVSVGAGLIPVFLGIFILTGVLITIYCFFVIEQKLAQAFFKQEMASLTLRSSSGGFWKRIKAVLSDSLLWSGVFYFSIKLFLGTFSFSITTALLSSSVTLAFLPLFLQIRRGDDLDFYIERAWNYPFIVIAGMLAGVFLTFISLHVVNWLAWLHKKLAVSMIRR